MGTSGHSVGTSHDRPLHVGPHSVVRRGDTPGTIVKVYRETALRVSRDAAEIEFGRLRRLYGALAEVDGAVCPRPLGWGEQEDGQWYLAMEEVDGTSLLGLMRRRDRPEPRQVARGLVRALRGYAAVFGEPHFGIKPKDVLVDAATGDVVILDFEPCTKARYLEGVGEGACPAASSAAMLLGLTLHLAAAPHALQQPRANRWLVAVAEEAVAGAGGHRAGELRDVVRAVYRHRYERGEQRWRPAWYRMRWQALGRPALHRAGIG
jgi:serine/threonine protein kinase